MKSSLIDRDKGWKRIRGEMTELSRLKITVGIQSGSNSSDGEPLVDRAAANEFGTDTIPERSFMRASFDESQAKLLELSKKLWSSTLRGQRNAMQSAHLLGQEHEGQIKEKITSLKDPPNAQSTVAQKGSSNPLIDSGEMRRSVRYEVKK